MPARPLPAAVLFDWDGTLVDTIPMIYRANVVALRAFGFTLSREWYRERYTPDWRRSYRELGIPEHQWDAVAARWAEQMRLGRPRALPHARPAIRRLRGHGIRLGLVTASTRNVVEHNLARLNLDGTFEAIRYADDVERPKPHPDALLEALDDLDVEAGDAVYVGDTTVDLAMAGAAGTPFVAVGTTTAADTFRDAGVDRVWPGVGAWVDELLGPRQRASPAADRGNRRDRRARGR
ncbi:MAG TPA: HAD family hydrolase [Candidatus Limnocylindrales bacterium]|nr:HAD family hydrolase [Candidatus Limnocylindrales bacterium]